jgi:DNA polymerase I-like protein with 3'-5' exonuclease and polymerase domains
MAASPILEFFKPLPLEQARKEYDEPLKRAFTYKALNKLIQGSAADMTKKKYGIFI